MPLMLHSLIRLMTAAMVAVGGLPHWCCCHAGETPTEICEVTATVSQAPMDAASQGCGMCPAPPPPCHGPAQGDETQTPEDPGPCACPAMGAAQGSSDPEPIVPPTTTAGVPSVAMLAVAPLNLLPHTFFTPGFPAVDDSPRPLSAPTLVALGAMLTI